MNKKILKRLVLASYVSKKLDSATVNKIADLLPRRDLKEYIKALKSEELKKTVTVTSPFVSQWYKKEFEAVFPNKEIIFEHDQTLLLGIRITDNDTVYDLSLQHKLEKIQEYLEEQYD